MVEGADAHYTDAAIRGACARVHPPTRTHSTAGTRGEGPSGHLKPQVPSWSVGLHLPKNGLSISERECHVSVAAITPPSSGPRSGLRIAAAEMPKLNRHPSNWCGPSRNVAALLDKDRSTAPVHERTPDDLTGARPCRNDTAFASPAGSPAGLRAGPRAWGARGALGERREARGQRREATPPRPLGGQRPRALISAPCACCRWPCLLTLNRLYPEF